MDIIVVIQNEPRDGDIVYGEKDLEAFKKRVVELDMVEADVADEVVILGQTYYNDEDSSTIIGYEVKLPLVVHRVCRACWYVLNHGYSPDVGDTVHFECVASKDCEALDHGYDDEEVLNGR